MVNLIESLSHNNILSKAHAEAIRKYAQDKSIPELTALQMLGKNIDASQLQFILENVYSDKEIKVFEGDTKDIKVSAELSDIIDYIGEALLVEMTDKGTTIYLTRMENKGEISKALYKAGQVDLNWYFLRYADYRSWMEKFGKSLTKDITEKRSSLQDLPEDIEETEEDEEEERMNEGVISGKVYKSIKAAVQMGASDIHFEPGKPAQIRVRIDGLLTILEKVNNTTLEKMVRSLKSSSNMRTDIYEPSGGSKQYKIDDKIIDCRISSCPTVDGDKVVVRFLNISRDVNNIRLLGMSREQQKEILRMTKRSSGLILLTGPTGAGKTATLMSLIHDMKDPAISIDTIEHPVEQRIHGITQRQVEENKGLTFDIILKEVLRQDPDVIMVGETRDVETAKTIMVAGNTGHLVLTTLHTNTSCTAVTRLIDMGVEPFLVSSNIIGVVNQRLLRRICPSCKTKHIVNAEDIENCNLSEEWLGKTTYKASEGCAVCTYTGYVGRVGIYEILTVDQDMKDMIRNNMSVSEFERMAKQKGLRVLRERVVDYLNLGIVSLEELERTLYDNTLELEYVSQVSDTYEGYND